MLPYLWLLLPVLGHAAHRDPHFHVPRWSLSIRGNDSSTTSSTARPTGTGPATTPASDSPCKRVHLTAHSAENPSDDPGKRVPAELAYECLNSIPFNQSAAAALVEAMRPYLDWQSTTSYVKDPPEKVRVSASTPTSCTDSRLQYAKNVQPPYDFWSVFNAIEANVAHGAYDSEYDFGWDLYQSTQQLHEGHFMYIPDVVGLFQFGRTTALVSVSEDGVDLPLVYAYSDVLESHAGNSSFKPSHVVQIDGTDTTDFLLDLSQYGSHQDNDTLWNNLFYSLAQVSLGAEGLATGAFIGNGQGGLVYPGPTTTLTFANGSNVTNENFARFAINLRHIDSGADMYQEFLSQPPEAYRNALGVLNDPYGEMEGNDTRAPYHKPSIRPPYLEEVDDALSSQSFTPTTAAIGYPSPVVRHYLNLNAGYFLEGPSFDDVAVLTVASFMGKGDLQEINSDFIAAALAANKTKLIIDLSANGGGYGIQAFDLFKQLFPSSDPYDANRIRAHESIDLLGQIYSGPINRSDPILTDLGRTPPWNYHTEVDSNKREFSSWEQKYGPHPQGPGNDTFTSLIRWNLSDPQTRVEQGIWVTGYGDRSNMTSQPFQPQNVVVVTDGYCASTCALLTEFLRQEAGVRTISLGGRPSLQPMQSVGGTKGGQMIPWTQVFEYVQGAAFISSRQAQHQDLNHTALARYSYLPIARSKATAINFRNVFRRDDDEQTPHQFVYEPAQCRIFYTKQMVLDQSVVWKTVADTVWGEGNACIAGENSFSGMQSNITAGVAAERHKMWSIRDDFDIEEAWRGLEVETKIDWFDRDGDCVILP
jgi:hypothetical protein